MAQHRQADELGSETRREEGTRNEADGVTLRTTALRSEDMPRPIFSRRKRREAAGGGIVTTPIHISRSPRTRATERRSASRSQQKENFFFHPPTQTYQKIFAVRAPQGASHRWVIPGLNGYRIRRASGRELNGPKQNQNRQNHLKGLGIYINGNHWNSTKKRVQEAAQGFA